MAHANELARLTKLTRQVLLKDLLREIQDDTTAVIGAIESWRTSRTYRHWSPVELEHFAVAADKCACLICTSIHAASRAPSLIEPKPSKGEQWISDILAFIDKHAPGITALQLKRHLLWDRMFRGRIEEELLHFARNGYFHTHTPEQAEAERQMIQIERLLKEEASQGK